MAPTCSASRSSGRKVLLALLPALLAAAGCPNGAINIPGLTKPAPKIAVTDLASQLGMTVRECTSTQAELRGGPNNVTLFADTFGGRVYVNGKAIDSAGDITPGAPGFQPTLSADYVAAIRKQLQPFTPPGGQTPPTAGIRPPPDRRPVPPIGTVVVDPGHGGRQPGAISVYRDEEKVIVLGIASTIAARLQAANVRVVMTRNSDKTVSLDERTALANKLMPDLFLAIHADSRDGPQAGVPRGYTILVPQRPSAPSHAAAEAIDRRLTGVSAERRGVRTDSRNVHVLRDTRCPAVLVETGFLSNSYDASLLADRRYRDKLADAITLGVVDYLKTLKR